jgi:hypothetical protein
MLKGYRQKARRAILGALFAFNLGVFGCLFLVFTGLIETILYDILGYVTMIPCVFFALLAWYYWATGHGYPASNLFGLLLWQNLDDEHPEEEEPS